MSYAACYLKLTCLRHIHLKILNDYQIKPHHVRCSLPTCSWLKNWYCMVFTVRCSFRISLVMTLLKLIKALPIWFPDKFNCRVKEIKRRYCNTTMNSFYLSCKFALTFVPHVLLLKHLSLEWIFNILCVLLDTLHRFKMLGMTKVWHVRYEKVTNMSAAFKSHCTSQT